MLRPRPVNRKTKNKKSSSQQKQIPVERKATNERKATSERKATKGNKRLSGLSEGGSPNATHTPEVFAAVAIPIQSPSPPKRITAVSWSVVVPTHRREQAVEGLLLGCAIGEAIARTGRGLRTHEARRVLGRGPLRYPFPFRRGLTGDRTHSLIMTIQAMLRSKTDSHQFSSLLKQRIVAYQFASPVRYAWNKTWQMVRCLVRRSTETRSAGLGDDALVRGMVISVMLQGCTNTATRWFQHSLAKTHADQRALQASLLVGHATQIAQVTSEAEFDPLEVLDRLMACTDDPQLKEMLLKSRVGIEERRSVAFIARQLGWNKGMPNDVHASAVMGIYAWIRHYRNFRRAVERITLLGGHCTSAAVVTASLIAISHGRNSIPIEWIERLSLFPYTRSWQELVIERVKDWPHGVEDIQNAHGVPSLAPLQIVRNVVNTANSLVCRVSRIPFRVF